MKQYLHEQMSSDGWRSCVHAIGSAEELMEILRDAEGFPSPLADDINEKLEAIRVLLYEGME